MATTPSSSSSSSPPRDLVARVQEHVTALRHAEEKRQREQEREVPKRIVDHTYNCPWANAVSWAHCHQPYFATVAEEDAYYRWQKFWGLEDMAGYSSAPKDLAAAAKPATKEEREAEAASVAKYAALMERLQA